MQRGMGVSHDEYLVGARLRPPVPVLRNVIQVAMYAPVLLVRLRISFAGRMYTRMPVNCSRNDCVFVHTCASCGGNHTAADCRAYDRSKAEAAAISRGGQTRRPENRR